MPEHGTRQAHRLCEGIERTLTPEWATWAVRLARRQSYLHAKMRDSIPNNTAGSNRCIWLDVRAATHCVGRYGVMEAHSPHDSKESQLAFHPQVYR